MEKLKLLGFITKYRRGIASIAFTVGFLIVIKSISPNSTSTIVVATRDIPAGVVIHSSDVKLVKNSYTWESMVTDLSTVQSKYSAIPMKSGEPVIASFLRDRRVLDETNSMAVSLALPFSISAKSLQNYDRVNVFGTTRENTTVLVAEHALVIRLDAPDRDSNFNSNNGVVELAVSPSAAEKIAMVNDSGFTFVKLPN